MHPEMLEITARQSKTMITLHHLLVSHCVKSEVIVLVPRYFSSRAALSQKNTSAQNNHLGFHTMTSEKIVRLNHCLIKSPLFPPHTYSQNISYHSLSIAIIFHNCQNIIFSSVTTQEMNIDLYNFKVNLALT